MNFCYALLFFNSCYILLPFCCLSQNSNFVTFGIEDGLINSQVKTLNQDASGTLWIGTLEGLTEYNGKSFTAYTQKDGLAEDWVTSSYKDQNQNLWFGHWGGGASLYLYKKRKFIDLKLEEFTNYTRITAITGDTSGTIWFGTEGAGIIKYGEGVGGANAVIINKGLSSNNISSLFADDKGNLWIGTDKGITIYNTSANTAKIFNTKNGLPTGKINCIIAAFNKEVWIGTEFSGIIRVNMKNPEPGRVLNITINDGLTSNNINTLYEDSEQNIWIGTANKGIVKFIPAVRDLQSRTLSGELNIFSNRFELQYYNANVFLEDREGNIWMGSDAGLNKYMGELFKLYNQDYGLPDNLIWSVLCDKEGSMWFGTSKGVSKFSFPLVNGKKQYNNPIVKNYTVEDGLSENIVISMFEDSKSNIWFGTENSGACVLLKETGSFIKYTTANGLSGNKIFSITADAKGNIWMGSTKGAAKINPITSSVTNYTTKDGLGGDKVYKIFKDSKGNLWFGILGGELTKFDGSTFTTFGEAEGLPARSYTQAGVKQKFITGITEDKDNNLWFCTYRGGMLKYDTRGEFTTFNTTALCPGNECIGGMSSDSPHFIISDDDNNIWLGLSTGIEKYDRQTGKFTLYGKQQGFIGIETNENAVSEDKDGNIWFGTIKGAVKFNPKKEKLNKTEPLTFTKGLDLYLSEAEFPENARFSYKQNYLTFHNIGVSLTNPSEVRYQYKLDGFDRSWTPPAKESSISYSNLPPGKYVFMVRSCNNDGVWNKMPEKYSFEIIPPFWQTRWFYVLCIIFTCATLYTAYKLRVRNLQRSKRILENTVKERTAEVVSQRDQLSKKNLLITDSINYAKLIQEAILPSLETVKKYLPRSFVLYKPKDIVSGDFYWVHENNGQILFAAVDCTGHGVPGAFMSIIGHDLLEQIVKEYNITKPSDILDKLNTELSKKLNYNTGNDDVKDGMDLVLCRITMATGILEFAGARNPLYIIRDKKIIEINGDIIPIGNRKAGNNGQFKNFKNHEIRLQKDDFLYLFSDGYPDQKGGPENIKFYYAPFRELLLKIHHLPLEEQRSRLDKTIEEWKGSRDQIDDILVIGVKI